MKLISVFLLTFTLSGCSQHKDVQNPPSGDIGYGSDPYTYRATYNGKEELKVGDKVRIMEYNFDISQKERQSRNFPLSSSKKKIGEATVSNLLSPHYYELKTQEPRSIPGNAFIEKM